MNESPHSHENGQHEKSLADTPPTPVPFEETPAPASPFFGCMLYTFVGVGTFVFVSISMMPALGATRSARLVWEERQAEIEKAVAEAEACDADRP